MKPHLIHLLHTAVARVQQLAFVRSHPATLTHAPLTQYVMHGGRTHSSAHARSWGPVAQGARSTGAPGPPGTLGTPLEPAGAPAPGGRGHAGAGMGMPAASCSASSTLGLLLTSSCCVSSSRAVNMVAPSRARMATTQRPAAASVSWCPHVRSANMVGSRASRWRRRRCLPRFLEMGTRHLHTLSRRWQACWKLRRDVRSATAGRQDSTASSASGRESGGSADSSRSMYTAPSDASQGCLSLLNP
mmetsp:Transcript_34975/g.77801  ORF Transcript_34975/g.77801 Transcript_34975/m.77801 type:complete len:245 (-) Transcript_34975:739-1473(-)